MRGLIPLILVIALIVAVGVALGGQAIFQPRQPLIVSAGFTLDTITPNADGNDDITEYSYELSENAIISIRFMGEDDQNFVFRDIESRARGEYNGLFSGVVDGYVMPGEEFGGQVERRLMPNGTYTWELEATTANGRNETQTGTLTLAEADLALPDISIFTISPDLFSPNQDGIRDRTQINAVLEKDAALEVYLLTPEGAQIFIPPQIGETREGEAGRHTFDYDGGIDAGSEPPPDGRYTVVASAQDAVGQRVTREAILRIEDGGSPLAEIAAQSIGVDVVFTVQSPQDILYSDLDTFSELIPLPEDPEDPNRNDITMQVGDILIFKLIVENYGDVPIRTHGAEPGEMYLQTQRSATFGDFDESGAWRVGIDCDTAVSDYPWRWRIGDENTLDAEYDNETRNTYYYLAPGKRATVWGGIRMTELMDSRNPQNCWAGLIHEDVGIAVINARVGARSIELVDPNATLYDEN